MLTMQYKVTRKTLILPFIGILVFVAYLYLFNIDIPEIIATIQTINLPVYAVAAALVLFEILFVSMSWRALLSFLSVKLSIVKAYLYVSYGTFVDIIIPAESLSSEITRVYLVTREHEGTGGKVVASLVVQRFMGMGVNIAGLLVGVGILLARPKINEWMLALTLVLAVLTAVFFGLLILLCIRRQWTLRIIDAVVKFARFISRGRWNLTKLKDEAVKTAEIFHDSMTEFRRGPKTLLASMLSYMTSWILSLLIMHFVFLALNYPVEWGTILLTYSIMAAVRAVPLGIPFEAGVPEITMTGLYQLFGVPEVLAATSTILSRILTLWLKFFIGFGAQQLLEFVMLRKNR
jgi:uncharacterized protein (TIRG00374 family)